MSSCMLLSRGDAIFISWAWQLYSLHSATRFGTVLLGSCWHNGEAPNLSMFDQLTSSCSCLWLGQRLGLPRPPLDLQYYEVCQGTESDSMHISNMWTIVRPFANMVSSNIHRKPNQSWNDSLFLLSLSLSLSLPISKYLGKYYVAVLFYSFKHLHDVKCLVGFFTFESLLQPLCDCPCIKQKKGKIHMTRDCWNWYYHLSEACLKLCIFFSPPSECHWSM